MTREEAIGYLKRADTTVGQKIKTRTSEALDMAIKALEILEEFEKAQIITGGRLNGRTYAYKCGLEDGKRKALEQEPCEDTISRQAVLDLIEHYNSDGLGSVFYGYEEGVKFADAVNKLPPVNPQEPTEWQQDHEILKAYSDGANEMLDKIRSEVEEINPWALAFAPSEYKDTRPQIVARVKSHILEIIDKYKEDA